MIEIDYLLNTSFNFLENIALRFGEGYGQEVKIKDSALVFPPGLANGKFEYHSINGDMSMVLIDCTFFEEIYFKRNSVMVNHFHAMSFNLSTISLMIERQDRVSEHIGDSWKNKILYSTSEKGLGWTIPANSHIKMVVIYFTRTWLLQHYKVDLIPEGVPHAEAFMNDRALQFSLDLDLELLLVLNELLESPAPRFMSNLYYEGRAKKIVAFVAARIAGGGEPGTKLNYEEVLQLINTVKQVEQELDRPMLLQEDLARRCFMSKSKFEKLFKAIYGKTFTDFFLNAKMKKAAELLLQGWSTEKTAQALGYTSPGHFVKVFRACYKIHPKSYRINK